MSHLPSLQPLQGRRLVLALSGGVACYKSAELLRLLVKAGAEVRVMMSEAAQAFITVATMQALSGQRVVTGQWDPAEPNHMPHINWGRDADAIILAPASADMMARIAQGRADDKKIQLLRGRTLINLFFEASTRTQSSFEIAGKRLGADVMNMSVSSSSMRKA